MRVLLVEDDPMIGEAVQAALKDASYAADWVKDGLTALSSFASQHYDLVLLDLGLPGKDGLEVLSRIRAQANAVPLLIITARDGLEDRLRGLDDGAACAYACRFAAQGWQRCAAAEQRRAVARPCYAAGDGAGQRGWCATFKPRVCTFTSPARAPRSHFVAQRIRRPHLWLGRRGREQCG